MNMISIISCATKADRMQVAVRQAGSGLARCVALLWAYINVGSITSLSLSLPLLHLHVIIIVIKGHICPSLRWG